MGSNRPLLKAGVDLQLQSAYDEGNWAVVARLAEKRARTLKDQHAEVIKVCAESQLGTALEKTAAVLYTWKAFKEGVVIKDVESMQLLDWACHDLTGESFFPEVLGPMRVRLAKAQSKDKRSVVSCLEDCLLHWDLNSAQQIAAVLDRTFPQVSKFHFWNIATTYMLSSSDQCAPDKRFLYRELSAKQALKAAQAAEQSQGENSRPIRALESEEEILLLFNMLESKHDIETWKRSLESPVLSPKNLLEKGQKDVFLMTVSVLSRFEEWSILFSLCKDCLSLKDASGRLSYLASDWAVWKSFIEAAAHEKEKQPNAIDQVFQLIDSQMSTDKPPPIYRRTLLLARVQATFELGPPMFDELTPSDAPKSSPRTRETLRYIHDQYGSTSCFEDIRHLVERLTSDELSDLLLDLLPAAAGSSEAYKKSALKTLGCKLRYMTTTMPQFETLQSKMGGSAKKVLETLAAESLHLYRQLEKTVPDEDETARAQQDFLADIALVAAMCFIKLSGFKKVANIALVEAKTWRPLLLAACMLEHQLLLSPRHSGILLMLVRIYLRLGAAGRAAQLWELVEVKRTIVDSLGPMFFDRLGGIDPKLASGPLLAKVVQSHYSASLRLRMPRRLTDAFDEEAYSSILEIPKYITSLRTSCTMAMGYLEERRAMRAMGVKVPLDFDGTALAQVTDETVLSRATDYGSFPNYESDFASCPMQDLLSLGPDPSNSRSHLGLLAEQFFALLSFRGLASQKPASALLATTNDHAFVVESLAQLASSLSLFLRDASVLTRHELVYFGILRLLSTMIIEAVQPTRGAAAADVLQDCMSSVNTSLELMADETCAKLPDDASLGQVLTTMSSLYQVSCLRDAAAASKLAAAYVGSYNDRQKERDRSGASWLKKDLVAAIKSLDSAAQEHLTMAKSWIADTRKEVAHPVLVEKIKSHVVDAETEAGDDAGQALEQAWQAVLRSDGGGELNMWAKKVADAWRTNISGWDHVKWE